MPAVKRAHSLLHQLTRAAPFVEFEAQLHFHFNNPAAVPELPAAVVFGVSVCVPDASWMRVQWGFLLGAGNLWRIFTLIPRSRSKCRPGFVIAPVNLATNSQLKGNFNVSDVG
jgi:hypothetical protein